MLEVESNDRKFQDENFLVRHSAKFNEETTEAMREARLISEGKISSKSFNTVEDLMRDLMSDADD
ncbi:MAG: hypothetical protein IJT57_01375 [Selenomonadaceae bacterium]|nr:hypothetical protein [Selenomonadaceae bacterium]MBQ7722949.1 hypothetical protein [Selenomonadaceae bacterium]